MRKLRVAILTSFDKSIASYHASVLLNAKTDTFELAGIVLASPSKKKNFKFFKRKIKKALKIGLWGTLNGIKMRSWFSSSVEENLNCQSIKEICSQHQIQLSQTKGLNSEATRIALQKLNVDVAVSLGNGFIAPSVYKIPKMGMINIHHEILPDYQNAQSVIWQLFNQSTSTGYTIHEVEREIDAGRILFQEHIPIKFEETLEETVISTHTIQWKASAKGLMQTLSNFRSLKYNAMTQGLGRNYTTPSRSEFRQIEANFAILKSEKMGSRHH